MRDIAVLLVRSVIGGLLAGHGGQKLFGWYGGQGPEATAGWLGSLGLRPPRTWAFLAGFSEFGGGLLMVLGLLNPVGPLLAIGTMLMAWVKVHRGKPIWSTRGGAELPLTNLAVALGLAIAGPGRLSLDALLGIRLPRWIGFLGLGGVVATVAAAYEASREPSGLTAGEGGGEAQPAGGEAGTPDDRAETSPAEASERARAAREEGSGSGAGHVERETAGEGHPATIAAAQATPSTGPTD